MNRKTLLGIAAFAGICAFAFFFVVYEVSREIFAKIAFARGIAALRQGQNNAAVSYFTVAVKDWDPEWRAASLVERAASYRLLKQSDRALADLTEALRQKPDNAHAWLLRGYVHDENDERQLAFADYQRVLQLDPNSAPAWYGSALYQERHLKDYTAARTSFREAIRCRPGYAKAYVGSAYCSSRLGDRDGAVSGYDAAIAINPKDAYPYSARAAYWLKQKDYERAVGDLNRALEFAPTNKTYLYDRSVAFERSKNFAAEIKDLSAILALDPRNEQALQDRGLSHRAMKDYADAVDDFTQLIRLTQAGEAYTDRARTYAKEGRYALARSDYEEATHLDFGHLADASKPVAWFLATCPDAAYRDGARAIDLATKACERSHWKDRSDLDTLAAADAEMGRFDEAVRHQRQALALVGDNPEGKVLMESRLGLYESHKPYRDVPLGTARK